MIGILGGFFGVGGSFIAGPALRLAGLDWNFAVGTDLAHIVGKSVVAARRHRALGNVDLRLGLIMAVGTIVGAEVGAQAIQILKRAGNVNFVVSVVSIVVYLSISTFMIWESRKTLSSSKGRSQRVVGKAAKSKRLFSVRSCDARDSTPQGLADDFATCIGNKGNFPVDDSVGGFRRRSIQRLSGGGAGYIRMPSMVYVLGIPTHLAVGTDLSKSSSRPVTAHLATRSKVMWTF